MTKNWSQELPLPTGLFDTRFDFPQRCTEISDNSLCGGRHSGFKADCQLVRRQEGGLNFMAMITRYKPYAFTQGLGDWDCDGHKDIAELIEPVGDLNVDAIVKVVPHSERCWGQHKLGVGGMGIWQAVCNKCSCFACKQPNFPNAPVHICIVWQGI